MKELSLSTKIMIIIFSILLLLVIGIGVLSGISNSDTTYNQSQTENPF